MIPTMVGIDGDRLRRLRLGEGLTQKELASAAGVSADTIVRWEKGRGLEPHASVLKKIATALAVRPADLLKD